LKRSKSACPCRLGFHSSFPPHGGDSESVQIRRVPELALLCFFPPVDSFLASPRRAFLWRDPLALRRVPLAERGRSSAELLDSSSSRLPVTRTPAVHKIRPELSCFAVMAAVLSPFPPVSCRAALFVGSQARLFPPFKPVSSFIDIPKSLVVPPVHNPPLGNPRIFFLSTQKTLRVVDVTRFPPSTFFKFAFFSLPSFSGSHPQDCDCSLVGREEVELLPTFL